MFQKLTRFIQRLGLENKEKEAKLVTWIRIKKERKKERILQLMSLSISVPVIPSPETNTQIDG